MYIKFALRNVKRSIKDYIIYIVTLTTCISLFYAFLSVTSKYYNPGLGEIYNNLEMIGEGLPTAIVSVSLLLIFLIYFVNKHIMLQRQKEFGLEILLGMEQKTVALIFFCETFVMGIFSMVLGIGLGVVVSQFANALLLTTFDKPFTLVWTLFSDTCIQTILLFMCIFILVGVSNTYTLSKKKIIDMLRASKENEADINTSKFVPICSILFAILLFYMTWHGYIKAQTHFKFDSRHPLVVQVMFYGNIILPLCGILILVWNLLRKIKGNFSFSMFLKQLLGVAIPLILLYIAVPVIKTLYNVPFDSSEMTTYMQFLVATMLFLIVSFFYLIGDFFTRLKEKSLNYRYHEENLFFCGQIISKLKTTSKTMSIITITLIVSICGFIGAVYLSGINMGHLKERMVFDLQMGNMYTPVYEEKMLSDTDYSVVREFLDEYHIEVKDDVYLETYLPKREQFHDRVKYDFPFTAIALSDYNALLAMKGIAPITLAEDEFATQWYALASEQEINSFIREHQTLETDRGTLTLAKNAVYTEKLSNNLYNSYTNGIYIIPDHIAQGLLAVEQYRYINLEEPLAYKEGKALEKVFYEFYSIDENQFELEQTALQKEQAPVPIYHLRDKTIEISDAKSYNFILQSVIFCGSTVLMVICFTMLALQQLSDAVNFKYRFGVLRRLGVDERKINKLVAKQLGIWFGLPVVFGYVVGMFICLGSMFAYIDETRAYIGFETLLVQVGFIAVILGLLFFCYYIATYYLFKRTINK